MALKTIRIENFLGGDSESQYSGSKGTYNIGLGIDPDFGLSDPDSGGAITTGVRTAGLLMPTRYEKFSSTLITAYPMWLIANPKDTNIYALTNAGFMVRYDSALANETAIDTTSIAFDAPSAGSFGGVATKTVAHTCTGSNLLLIAVLTTDRAVSAITATYNGVSMTAIPGGSGADPAAQSLNTFYLIGPATGAHNIVFNWTTNATGWVHGVSYTSVHQTTPLGTANTASGTGTTATVVVTSAVGELVVDAVLDDAQNFSVGGGQTSRYNETTNVRTASSTKAGAASVSMSWTMASSTTWASVAVPLKPVASGNNGNGAVYYNNYIYRATGTDVNRYGPLNNSPTLASGVWTGATLGSQTALVNTTYPTVGGVTLPNHPMHVHGDNKCYMGDYNTTANPGKGVIHYIATTKTTDEGDTNNSSTANKLVLPFGFLPTDIESYGVDLVISAIQSTSSTINQGRAALFFWDTTSTTFYRGPIYSQDPLITAMKSVNGELYVWSGNSTRGCRLSKYIGGDSLQEIMFIEDSPPPLPGAVESWGSRLAWGGSTSYPSMQGVVYAYGSKDNRLPNGLSNPIISTAGATTPLVTSILNYAHLSYVRPKLIVGWGNGTTYGIDKLSTTATYANVWRSDLFPMDNNFSLKRIRIPLSTAVATNMSIVPKLYIDNFQTTVTLPTISTSTALYSGKNKVLYQSLELDALGAMGQDNFLLELNFGGTQEVAVGFPILIDYEEFSDESS